MAHSPRFQVDNKDRIPADLENLGKKLNALPEEQRRELKILYERVTDSVRLRGRILSVAKEALERLRLEMACTQFDLEVTRREVESLKKELNDDQ